MMSPNIFVSIFEICATDFGFVWYRDLRNDSLQSASLRSSTLGDLSVYRHVHRRRSDAIRYDNERTCAHFRVSRNVE